MLQRSLLTIALCLSSNALAGLAFTPAASAVQKASFSGTSIFSSDPEQQNVELKNETEGLQNIGGIGEGQQYQAPRQIPQQPPVPQQRRMDPLLASLTKSDPTTANAPTTNIPLFGEVPANSVKVLVPIAVIGVVGFLYSIVVTLNSGDELNRIITQATTQASMQPNMQYDPNVCRGICSSQEKDLEGLKTFMESLRK